MQRSGSRLSCGLSGVRTDIVAFGFAIVGISLALCPAAAEPPRDVRALERELTIEAAESRLSELKSRVERAQKALQQLKADGQRRTRRRATASDARGSCQSSRKIVNGVPTFGYPTVGNLLYGANGGTLQTQCTGTLIGCNLFLTAAHCFHKSRKFEDWPDPEAWDLNVENYRVFLQHAGLHKVSEIHYPKGNVDPKLKYDFDLGDIAIVKLARSVTGVVPRPINTAGRPKDKTCGRIVGFGRTGGDNYDYGIKRDGSVKLASCRRYLPTKEYVCWNFDAPFGSPGDVSNTCNADSGGPLLVGASMHVAGTTVAGIDIDCGRRGQVLEGEDHSYDTNVYTYSPWIKAIAGAGLSANACGDVPSLVVDDEDGSVLNGRVVGFADELSEDAGQQQSAFAVEVPPGLAELRITMNGQEDGDSTNFDLYLLDGPPPGSGTPLCQQSDPSQLASCILREPKAGPRTLLIKRQSGTGVFQATVTFFPKKE